MTVGGGAMAQVLKLPDESELPASPQRKFVEELFFYYREAGRPALRLITGDIEARFDAFTASRGAIRRMLRGRAGCGFPVGLVDVEVVGRPERVQGSYAEAGGRLARHVHLAAQLVQELRLGQLLDAAAHGGR